MKRLNIYLAFLLVGMIMSSCDPAVNYERIIENKSSHDIWIKVNINAYPGFTKDSFLISKNSEQLISHYGGIGSPSQFKNCGMEDSTLSGKVVGNDSLRISKDINAESSWTYTKFSRSKCECRLILNESDVIK